MKLNWQGEGQKHYDWFGEDFETTIQLKWFTRAGETIYHLTSFGGKSDNGIQGNLLQLRIPDFLWQDTRPSLFNETVGDA